MSQDKRLDNQRLSCTDQEWSAHHPDGSEGHRAEVNRMLTNQMAILSNQERLIQDLEAILAQLRKLTGQASAGADNRTVARGEGEQSFYHSRFKESVP